jgi:hypothetical protein
MTRNAIALFALAAVLIAAGCGKAEEKPVAATPATASSAIDISALPEFLRYPGATAVEQVAVSTDDSKGTYWVLVTADQPTAIEAWYKASAEKAGWPGDGSKTVGVLGWTNADKTETVKLNTFPKDGKTGIGITHARKPD